MSIVAKRASLAAFSLALMWAFPCGAPAAPSPGPSPCGGIPDVADPAPTISEAFAKPIDDAGLLGLMYGIVHASESARKDLLAGADRPVAAAVRAQVQSAVVARCLGPLVSQAAVRVANELAVAWAELPPERVDAFVARRLIVALAAESARASLPAPVLAAALDGFPGVATPAALPTACAAPDSTPAVDAAAPRFPASAGRAGARLRMKVQLDALGYVSAVTLYKAAFDGTEGHDDLIAEALVAAGRSSYSPAKAGCNVRGSYLFMVTFALR